MKRTILTYGRQAFTGAAFCMAVWGTVLALGAGAFTGGWSAFREYKEALLEYGFHNNLFQTALQGDTMILALPVLAALPYTASCVEDIRSGFIREALPRTGVREYIVGKLTACLLSGGLAPALGVLLFYAASVLVFLPMEGALPEGAEAEPWLWPLISACALTFCSGAFWSLTGMTAATITGSRHMAYASPFILYYVLIILCERYLTGIYVWDPREWLHPQNWEAGVWGAVVLLLELTVLVGGIFCAAAERRIRQL